MGSAWRDSGKQHPEVIETDLQWAFAYGLTFNLVLVYLLWPWSVRRGHRLLLSPEHCQRVGEAWKLRSIWNPPGLLAQPSIS